MLKTDAGALAAALQIVLPACERRNTIPILGTVRLAVDDGGLMVSASNLDMQIDARALVSWNGGRVAFPTLPASDFPEMAFTGGKVTAAPDAGVLDALKRAQPFIGRQETRYYLTGVCLDGREKRGVNIVATNGSMLFATPAGGSLAAFDSRCTIVPYDAVRQWIALADKGPVTLRLDGNGLKLEIESADARLTTKLIDGQFPPWRHVVPSLKDYRRVPLQRAAFLQACGLIVGSFAKAEASAVLALSDGRLQLEASSPAFGDIALDLGPCDGRPFEIGFNQRYLRQCVTATRGELSIWVPDGGGALTSDAVVLAGSEAPDGEVVVLMPTRSFSRPKLAAPRLAEAA